MSAYLMDFMAETIRVAALQRICKAYRPDVDLCFVLSELGFVDEEEAGKQWIQSCGSSISEDGNLLVTKEKSVVRTSVLKKQNSLI